MVIEEPWVIPAALCLFEKDYEEIYCTIVFITIGSSGMVTEWRCF